MNVKWKTYLVLALIVGAVVGWLLFKKVIVSFFLNVAITVLVIVAAYAGIRFWWLRRRT